MFYKTVFYYFVINAVNMLAVRRTPLRLEEDVWSCWSQLQS